MTDGPRRGIFLCINVNPSLENGEEKKVGVIVVP